MVLGMAEGASSVWTINAGMTYIIHVLFAVTIVTAVRTSLYFDLIVSASCVTYLQEA